MMLDAIVQGILLGGYYAILASGLSLLFGVARLINLAHGDLAILGAYLVLALAQRGIDPFVACVPVLLIMAAPGSVRALPYLTRLRHFIKATNARRTALTDKRHARKLRCQIDLSTRRRVR
jgi:branched-subunit amino acid ABC-type transport system permease component